MLSDAAKSRLGILEFIQGEGWGLGLHCPMPQRIAVAWLCSALLVLALWNRAVGPGGQECPC